MNDYYDVSLKQARLDPPGISGIPFPAAGSGRTGEGMAKLFATEQFDRVIHTGRPGRCARYSLENPYAYADANLMGYI
ncbi:hypothetical protein LNP74_26560 [Klebsiella pneumoniae subsp. pneumoniae]|nr:hypothetical protein [Klebsiella pneumoniae subsp. pneumoniae]